MTLFHKKTATRSHDSLDVFIVAHEDDWQLFMGDVALRVIRSGAPTVFVYLTAGDAGRPAPYSHSMVNGFEFAL